MNCKDLYTFYCEALLQLLVGGLVEKLVRAGKAFCTIGVSSVCTGSVEWLCLLSQDAPHLVHRWGILICHSLSKENTGRKLSILHNVMKQQFSNSFPETTFTTRNVCTLAWFDGLGFISLPKILMILVSLTLV